MTKRISVWALACVIIITAALTFICTLLFGATLVSASDAPPKTAAPAVTAEVTEEAAAEPTVAEITAKLSTKIAELMAYYDKYYIGELDVDDLVEGVCEGLVVYSGDKYGDYYNAEEFKALTQDLEGEFAGIGVAVTYDAVHFGIQVITVYDDSPAMKAGVLPGDLIVGVEGESVASLGYDVAVSRIRGEIGTSVTLSLLRGENYTEALDVTAVRDTIVEQSVTYEEIAVDGIKTPLGYVSITTFNNTTPTQFKEAIGEGLTNDVYGFIIDLRNNGGGTLSSVVAMLDMILHEGPIVRVQYKDGSETVYRSDMYGISKSVPFVLLVNERTASAAELFTSSLRDYGRAIVVGETTFGKGTVQSVLRLRDGAALRVSSALYAPPFSENFEGVGITPHVTVSLAPEFKNVNLSTLDLEDDAQLQAAISLYK